MKLTYQSENVVSYHSSQRGVRSPIHTRSLGFPEVLFLFLKHTPAAQATSTIPIPCRSIYLKNFTRIFATHLPARYQMSAHTIMHSYYELRCKMEVISAWERKPTRDHETRKVQREWSRLIELMETMNAHPRFPNLAARGNCRTFREGWGLLEEYRDDWQTPPLPMIDDDWKGQSADFRQILLLWEDVGVLYDRQERAFPRSFRAHKLMYFPCADVPFLS